MGVVDTFGPGKIGDSGIILRFEKMYCLISIIGTEYRIIEEVQTSVKKTPSMITGGRSCRKCRHD